MARKIYSLIFIFIIILFVVGCTKEDRELQLARQESSIESYLSRLEQTNRIERNGGSNRVVIKEGVGDLVLERGDSLIFYYSGYIFSNGFGPLFVTNNPDVAEKSGFPLQGGVKRVVLTNKELLSGLVNGLEGVKKGEVCNVVFSAKYGFYNTEVFNVPKMSPLIFEVVVEDIVKN